MTAIRTNYSVTLQSFVNAFDQGLDYVVNRSAAIILGSRLQKIERVVERLPREVTQYNSAIVEEKLKVIISQLSSSYLVQENATLKTQLDTIEHKLLTGWNYAPSKIEKGVRDLSRLYTYVMGDRGGRQGQSQTDRVTDTLNSLKGYLQNLTPSQKAYLNRQSQGGEVEAFGYSEIYHFTSVAKHEIKAQLFNLTTLNIISAVALAFFGLIGLKTLAISVAINYSIRTIADRSLSVTNIEKLVSIPIAIQGPLQSRLPIGGRIISAVTQTMSRIPLVERVLKHAAILTHISIPTRRGCLQLIDRVHNYGAAVGYTTTMTHMSDMNGADDSGTDLGKLQLLGNNLVTECRRMQLVAGWRNTFRNIATIYNTTKRSCPHLWGIVQLASSVNAKSWKPNFLVINGVVIFKNGTLPFSLMAKLAYKAYKGELN